MLSNFTITASVQGADSATDGMSTTKLTVSSTLVNTFTPGAGDNQADSYYELAIGGGVVASIAPNESIMLDLVSFTGNLCNASGMGEIKAFCIQNVSTAVSPATPADIQYNFSGYTGLPLTATTISPQGFVLVSNPNGYPNPYDTSSSESLNEQPGPDRQPPTLTIANTSGTESASVNIRILGNMYA